MNKKTAGWAISSGITGGPTGATSVKTNATQVNALIAYIQTALQHQGWTCFETSVGGSNPQNCHLICYQEQDPDGTRRGWGLFDRFYCWTQAWAAITGRPWWECAKLVQNPDNGGRKPPVRITVPGPFKGKGGFAANNHQKKDDPKGLTIWDNGGLDTCVRVKT